MKLRTYTTILFIFLVSINPMNAQETNDLVNGSSTTRAKELETKTLEYKKEDVFSSDSKTRTNINFQIYATTNYIWRDDILDYAAIQPSTTYSFGQSGLSLNVWGSVGAGFETNNLEGSLTFNYTQAVSKNVTASFGMVYYYAPVIEGLSNSNFGEIYTSIALPSIFLQPSITSFVSDQGAVYSSFSSSQQLYGWKSGDVGFNGALGHRFNDVTDNNGFRDLSFGVYTTFQIVDGMVRISLQSTRILPQSTIHFQVGINIALK